MLTYDPPEPFRLEVPNSVLEDLRERLARTRWPDEIAGAGWRHGCDPGFMRRLVARWKDVFEWRVHEAALNAFQQFRARIDGIDMHFIHEPTGDPQREPLLLLHGWPGSVWEFNELIPRLTDPARFGGNPDDAVSVVAASLPGFPLSFRAGQRRVGVAEMADLLATLMSDVLGYPRFRVQGGDWGSYLAVRLAHAYRERVVAIHLNFLPLAPGITSASGATAEDRAFHEQLRSWQSEEAGYSAIQGTKPQTLAQGLTDSPSGLAAWIAEKFYSWSDHNGSVEHAVALDSMLANITLYWVTGAINSSFWPYYAARHEAWALPADRLETPTAFASFPGEIRHPPRSLAERLLNIRRWTEMPRGGHFPALEVPDLLAADLLAFYRLPAAD
jgi:microsomal epoxide hydrolase